MFYDKYISNRQIAMLFASSWCFSAGFAEPADLPEMPAKNSLVAVNAPAPSGNPSNLESTGDLALIPGEGTQLAAVDPKAVATAGAPVKEDNSGGGASPAKSQNVTINLINRMVERGLLSKEDAADLIKQAETDAAQARSQANLVQSAASQAAEAAKVAQSAAQAASQSAASDPMELADSKDSVRVTYVPENVKAEMRDEIKQEVMEEARQENWAAPRLLPSWVTRFRLFGDIRVRYNGSYYPRGNDNTGAFPNFNSINTGAPFDVTGNVYSPQYNVDRTRQSFRLRARMGVEADMGDNFTAGVRIATGENNSPTSTNQSMGLANGGQGGNFSKYAIWLDRAFLKYEIGGQPNNDLALLTGRFDNPFFSPTELIWDDDLGFDGAAFKAKYEVLKGVTPFAAGGAFPVFNTDLNFSSNQPSKFKSEDKYLYGGQLGINWQINHDFNAKVAAAYYYFDGVEGKLSDPFVPLTSADQGNTDGRRPSFAQRGNTYMALRNITPTAQNNYGTINQWQYFGLATPFHEFAVSGQLDYNHFEPFQVSLFGDFVKNLAFDQSAINAIAVNNRGPISQSGISSFAGGDTGWIVGLRFGSAALQKRWDWNTFVNYRYLESDAVVDGMNDSDFGGGGTNLKGYSIGGSLALSPRVWLSLRWMSATAIAGPTYKNDIVQFDINGKF